LPAKPICPSAGNLSAGKQIDRSLIARDRQQPIGIRIIASRHETDGALGSKLESFEQLVEKTCRTKVRGSRNAGAMTEKFSQSEKMFNPAQSAKSIPTRKKLSPPRGIDPC
jgi:hypothetical protein